MLKKALELWKKERIKKGTTLHRRLLLFFSLISVSIILIFTLLLSLFGINGKQAQTVQNHLNTELSIIYDKIDADFGVKGTDSRAAFDRDAETFCLAATLREERLKAGFTQQELAEKIGTKKSYISKLENGKSDVQLSTLFRIFEGLGRRVSLSIF